MPHWRDIERLPAEISVSFPRGKVLLAFLETILDSAYFPPKQRWMSPAREVTDWLFRNEEISLCGI